MPEPVEVPVVSEEPEIKDESVENTADPEALFAKGKRNLLCGETQKAVNALQEACRLQAKKHGEMSEACAESYYLYGVALLELSRMESGVLGNALQGITTQEAGDEEEKESDEDKKFTETDNYTDTEKEKISEEVLDAMLESSDKTNGESAKEEETSATTDTAPTTSEISTEEGADKNKGEEGKESGEGSIEKMEASESSSESKTEKSDEAASSTDDKAATESEETDKKETETGDKEETEEDMEEEGEEGEEDVEVEESADKSTATEGDDDISNLQIAWEMLELAKNIYKKQDSAEMKLKHSDCLLKLGEIGIESEQYAQAIEDIKECLTLQMSAGVSKTDRRLAETHYQLGLAHYHAVHYSDAIENYRKAIEIIQARVGEVTEQCKSLGSTEAAAEGAKQENGAGETEGEKEKSAVIEKEGEKSDELKQLEEELSELNALVPEIMNKIEDAEEDLRNADKVKAASQEDIVVSETTFQGSASTDANKEDKPVTNISNLVRRKRKPDEDDEPSKSDEETKKLKTADESTTEQAASEPSADSATASEGAAEVMCNGSADSEMTPVEEEPKPEVSAATDSSAAENREASDMKTAAVELAAGDSDAKTADTVASTGDLATAPTGESSTAATNATSVTSSGDSASLPATSEDTTNESVATTGKAEEGSSVDAVEMQTEEKEQDKKVQESTNEEKVTEETAEEKMSVESAEPATAPE